MKRYIISSEQNKIMNPRSPEYISYLSDHIQSVGDSWFRILRNAIEEDEVYKPILSKVDELVRVHDASKYDAEEYGPYLNYFYPSKGHSKDQVAFDLAWLHHIHNNPHHSQHWILIRDEGEVVPMDMPVEYICEMLCDWHSFSSKDPESTAYNWYNKNKKNFTFSEKTRKTVENLIEFLKEPLVGDS